MNPPGALWAGVPGIGILVWASYVDGPAAGVMAGIGGLLLLVAVVVLAFWARDVWVEQQARLLDSRDRQYKLAEVARGMSSEQIKFVTNATFGKSASIDGETYLHGTDAPLWFVAEFLDRSYQQAACPVRTWNDGTDERKWAQQITDILVSNGYALAAIGHYSARWVAGVTPDTIRRKLNINPSPAPKTSPEGGEIG